MPRKRRPPRPGALSDLAPLRILRKILLLQASYYVSAIVLIVFTVLVAGNRISPDLLLNWRTLRGDTTVGWMLALVWLLNALVSVVFLMIFVVRSKLVADFAFTVHFIQLVVTSLYTHHIPTSLFWWGTQAASTFLMTILGVWACQWRELRPMSFNFGGGGSSTRTQTSTAGNDEVGIQQGGRGPDSSGVYELVDRSENV